MNHFLPSAPFCFAESKESGHKEFEGLESLVFIHIRNMRCPSDLRRLHICPGSLRGPVYFKGRQDTRTKCQGVTTKSKITVDWG